MGYNGINEAAIIRVYIYITRIMVIFHGKKKQFVVPNLESSSWYNSSFTDGLLSL